MNPDDLSKKHSESGEQKAVFAWAAMAQRYGFAIADDMDAYSRAGLGLVSITITKPVPVLEWLHAIPNGGNRDAKTAALMKAEGVRRGVADIFLPVPKRWGNAQHVSYCGLYIEMKTTIGRQSDEQHDFERHCNDNCYVYRICRTWREAADTIKEYLS